MEVTESHHFRFQFECERECNAERENHSTSPRPFCRVPYCLAQLRSYTFNWEPEVLTCVTNALTSWSSGWSVRMLTIIRAGGVAFSSRDVFRGGSTAWLDALHGGRSFLSSLSGHLEGASLVSGLRSWARGAGLRGPRENPGRSGGI